MVRQIVRAGPRRFAPGRARNLREISRKVKARCGHRRGCWKSAIPAIPAAAAPAQKRPPPQNRVRPVDRLPRRRAPGRRTYFAGITRTSVSTICCAGGSGRNSGMRPRAGTAVSLVQQHEDSVRAMPLAVRRHRERTIFIGLLDKAGKITPLGVGGTGRLGQPVPVKVRLPTQSRDRVGTFPQTYFCGVT